MKQSALFLCSVSVLLFMGAQFARAQAASDASGPRMSITAGGFASGFESDDNNDKLVGAGAFVDVRFRHWVQVEGEGRWLYWNQTDGEKESNYLVGPRVPVVQIGRKTEVFGKALIGVGKMTFPYGYGYGNFTALAFGGTVDYHLNGRLTVRGDFEYQDWPQWLNSTALLPYGISAGVGYRIF